MTLDISKIKQYPAPYKEYHKEVFTKHQIYLHHTCSGSNSKGDMDYLNTDEQGAVNVPLFIDRDGTIWQAFPTKYYSAHLGVPQSTFQKFKVNSSSLELHKHSVAIELDSWGYLVKKGEKYYSYANVEVKPENVTYYPDGFLGQKYYEKYYEPQLKALKDVLIYLCDTYGISKEYHPNMWEVSADALSGKNGIWTHVSVRETGKWDTHPQKQMIEMLKSLKS